MNYELIERAKLSAAICKEQGFEHTAEALLALAHDLARDDSGPFPSEIVDETIPVWPS